METSKIPLRDKSGIVVAYSIIDNDDFRWAGRNKWYLRKDNGYVVRNSSRAKGRKHRPIYLHREVLSKMGIDLSHLCTDHIDCDPLNNTRGNLRAVNATLNQANQKIPQNNTTGFKGVRKPRQTKRGLRWEALIHMYGKYKSIGSYASATGAAKAYDYLARQLFGECARLNFPTDGERGCR